MPEIPSAEMQYDKDARVVGNVDAVLALANGPCTDLIVASHGWNNDFATALRRYEKFIETFQALRQDNALDFGRPYRPLLVGIFWLPVVWLQVRLRRLAAAARDAGQPLPPAYHRLYRLWFACGVPAFAAVLAIVWLMVAKPSLG